MNVDEFLWDRVKHEENLFTSRANFFLVAESMLFAGVATLIATEKDSMRTMVIILCALGAVATLIWLAVNIYQRTITWDPARKALFDLGAKVGENGLAKSYNTLRTTPLPWYQRSANLMGYLLPLILIGAWLLLLIKQQSL